MSTASLLSWRCACHPVPRAESRGAGCGIRAGQAGRDEAQHRSASPRRTPGLPGRRHCLRPRCGGPGLPRQRAPNSRGDRRSGHQRPERSQPTCPTARRRFRSRVRQLPTGPRQRRADDVEPFEQRLADARLDRRRSEQELDTNHRTAGVDVGHDLVSDVQGPRVAHRTASGTRLEPRNRSRRSPSRYASSSRSAAVTTTSPASTTLSRRRRSCVQERPGSPPPTTATSTATTA